MNIMRIISQGPISRLAIIFCATLRRFAETSVVAMQTPEVVEVSSGENPVGSVIWLHGLGADGHDFEAIVPELRLPSNAPLRFVFPHAPLRPVTVNGGMTMRAWYDIVSFDTEGRTDEEGVKDSRRILEKLISREIERGIDAGRIVVAGFSQGGAIAVHTVLNTHHDLGGLMALSTYLPLPNAKASTTGRKDLPVFMAHGTQDPVLPVQWGRASADRLTALGYDVNWHEYAMAHAVCAQEIADISTWLSTIYG